MHDVLSFSRLWNYMKWNLLFTKKRYLYILALIPGIYIIFFLFVLLTGNPYTPSMTSILPIVMLISPVALEPTNNERENDGKILFTFPVSSFERFLSMWLRCVIIFPLLGAGIFYLMHYIFSFFPFTLESDFFREIIPDILNNYRTFYIWIVLQSIGMVLTASFRQKEQWKVAIIFVFLLVVVISVTIFTSFSKIGVIGNGSSPTAVFMSFGHAWPAWAFSTMKYYLLFLFPVGMWIVTFFKIREKEI